MDERIIIKGNKSGLIAEINMHKFSDFTEMLELLLSRLSKGKRFYRRSTLTINTSLNLINDKDVEHLEKVLFDEIDIKDIIWQDDNAKEKEKEKEKKTFSGVYEGKTKFLRKTVRGGQSIRYNGNIVIIGDINSGAEVTAAGNIIVLGAIKGNVSAGANGNTKAIIAAFSLQPEILKISNIVTLSPDDSEEPEYPEVAKVKDGAIIVEPYLPNKYIY
ncbi:septum site-determining protein MinC [Clostridium baratii]|uniref:Probable septum site-determining protein MinC n=1 Tax=Clostridium baratii str. Sullivan TaxID=1415775 RepID=A0A0A7FVR0_9CLOT|nr:septum site-determining protein MinC [Clostridium baratii]AIY83668.1 septum site-determining protein MinC [Clostridium baratii str. Sullivan]MBS6005462.1 septum site-determining protein MinC [Clostridium baratii]MDU1052529.1 septum site-determining protein MinC [Clostridium baratii]